MIKLDIFLDLEEDFHNVHGMQGQQGQPSAGQQQLAQSHAGLPAGQQTQAQALPQQNQQMQLLAQAQGMQQIVQSGTYPLSSQYIHL